MQQIQRSMTGAVILLARILLSSSALARLSAGRESWQDLRQYDGKFRLGLELEVSGVPAQRILRYYNLAEHFHRNKEIFKDFIDSSYFDFYLDNPENLAKLPQNIARIIRQEADRLGVEPKDIWRSRVSLADKQRFTDARLMPAWVNTRYFWLLAASAEIREGVDPKIGKFLEGFSVHPDNAGKGQFGVYEFTHKEDMEIRDVDRFFRDLAGLATITGLTEAIDRKERVKGFSYHVHISRERKIPDVMIRLMNYRLMLIMFARNPAAAFSTESTVAYRSDINNKGLLRKIAANRFELRFHPTDPVSELRDVFQVLDRPDTDASDILADRLKETMTPELLNQRGTTRPEAVVDFMRDILPELNQSRREFFAPMIDRAIAQNEVLRATVNKAIRDGALTQRSLSPDPPGNPLLNACRIALNHLFGG